MNLRELLFLHAASGGGGSLVEKTATGNPVSFTTQIAKPVKSITVPLSYTQAGSGDPYPPGGGKNKFDKDAVVRRDNYAIEYDGTERATETAGYTENFIPVKPSTHYTYSGSGMRLPIYYNENKEFLSREPGQDTPFTLSTSAYTHYIRIQYRLSDVDMSTWQLEEGSSATTYAPYSNVRPISGVSSLFCLHAKKNMATIRGYSAANVNYPALGTLTNDYGTIISAVDPNSSVTITQTSSTTEYSKSHYRNGYFIVLLEPYCVIDNQRYDVSVKITNIVNNPLDASLSDIRLISSGGSEVGVGEVKDNTIIFKNILYKENLSTPRYSFAIRNCGMSYTASEFMVTPADTNDGVYEPYDGAKLDVVFTALGKNLLKGVESGAYTTSGIKSANAKRLRCVEAIEVQAGQIYTISAINNAVGQSIKVNGNYYSEAGTERMGNFSWSDLPCTITIPTGAKLLTVTYKFNSEDDISATDISHAQIELGEATTSYEPYTNSVYGGSLDLVSGVLTLTHQMLSTTWGAGTNSKVFTSNERRRMTLPFTCIGAASAVSGACNVASWDWDYEKDSPHFYNHNGYSYVFLPVGTDDSTEIQIVGKLATPVTVQLTPEQTATIKGINTFWTDTTGDLTIEYYDKA